jgi:hypothetical protein
VATSSCALVHSYFLQLRLHPSLCTVDKKLKSYSFVSAWTPPLLLHHPAAARPMSPRAEIVLMVLVLVITVNRAPSRRRLPVRSLVFDPIPLPFSFKLKICFRPFPLNSLSRCDSPLKTTQTSKSRYEPKPQKASVLVLCRLLNPVNALAR